MIELTEEQQRILKISYLGEHSLKFKLQNRSLELLKYNDGDTEFEIEQYGERNTFVLTKEQILIISEFIK